MSAGCEAQAGRAQAACAALDHRPGLGRSAERRPAAAGRRSSVHASNTQPPTRAPLRSTTDAAMVDSWEVEQRRCLAQLSTPAQHPPSHPHQTASWWTAGRWSSASTRARTGCCSAWRESSRPPLAPAPRPSLQRQARAAAGGPLGAGGGLRLPAGLPLSWPGEGCRTLQCTRTHRLPCPPPAPLPAARGGRLPAGGAARAAGVRRRRAAQHGGPGALAPGPAGGVLAAAALGLGASVPRAPRRRAPALTARPPALPAAAARRRCCRSTAWFA